MAKLSLQDLANVLVEKNGLGPDEAEHFVTALFDSVLTGIERDKLVKIKGLGTFKVIDVDARESVNVNTGERVLIDSHSKVTFTPDATMKELVNKPFSGFETVVLNEGVEFEDMTATEEEAVPAEEEETTSASEKVTPPVAETKETVAEREEIVAETEENVAESEENVAESEENVAESEENVAESEEIVAETEEAVAESETEDAKEVPMVEFLDAEENETKAPVVVEATKETPWWLWLLVVLLSLGVGFAGGYFYANYEATPAPVAETVAEDETQAQPKDSVEAIVETTEEVAADSVAETVNEPVAEPAPEPAPEPATEPAKVEEPDYLKYEAMDSRVRTGAYYIMGTASVVKAREGDNVARVSRRYLGEGMSCYVEVYNGMSASTILKEGQEIKIPKVVLKKSIKK